MFPARNASTATTSIRSCSDEDFVARVDLKADRSRGVLRVNAAWIEPGYDAFDVATELASELKIMAEWLGLGAIEIVPRGDLAPALAAA